MKRNRLIDFLIIVLLSTQAKLGLSQDVLTWNHGQHFLGGVVVGGVGSVFSYRPVMAGAFCGMGAGLAKEWHDYQYHHGKFDVKDAAFTMLGGLASGLIVKEIRKHKHKRRSR